MNKLGWNLQTFFFVYKNLIYLFLQIWQKITFFKVSFKIRILEGLLIIFKVRQTHLIEFCYYCLIFIFRIICIFENLFVLETIFEILESNFHFRINWIFEKLFVYWTFVKILESNFHFSNEFYFLLFMTIVVIKIQIIFKKLWKEIFYIQPIVEIIQYFKIFYYMIHFMLETKVCFIFDKYL